MDDKLNNCNSIMLRRNNWCVPVDFAFVLDIHRIGETKLNQTDPVDSTRG